MGNGGFSTGAAAVNVYVMCLGVSGRLKNKESEAMGKSIQI